ncbi:hypothetical protein PVK06_001792 [Gossypium arboreum]|uniref:Uncharacterized protein n=1 Tax=Gossypium arboreum TaxID=29729 RepID=A0ABR0R2X5_GOSAR|nr:hypothetical protein PVK06_001792 [Gossypium arboreum]
MSSSRGKKAVVPSSKRRRESGRCIDWATVEQVQLPDTIRALLTIDPWEQFFDITKPTYLELTLELCSTFHLQVVMTNNDDPGTIHFRIGGPVRAMSVPEFGVSLGLYTDEFMEEEDMNALPCNIHISPSLCWKALAPLFHLRPQPLEGLSSHPFPTLSPCHIGTHLDWNERDYRHCQHPRRLLFMVHGECTRD